MENQSGSLSNIDAFDMSSLIISTWDCSQTGNRGPIWQDVKSAFSSLKGGNHSGSSIIFNELRDKSINFNLVSKVFMGNHTIDIIATEVQVNKIIQCTDSRGHRSIN